MEKRFLTLPHSGFVQQVQALDVKLLRSFLTSQFYARAAGVSGQSANSHHQ
jgi:hypothetical protein